ncbi:NAD(P)-dependent alcohol dehydrogenase [Haliscomenobacter hydrossis]|uniref:NADPH:quinone reductase n=1 Tax=Haliscomenobacter hydrossis (strain ATCC 27775 / DSM 1100 / LMG 10767 / O) TaxID=760192 RepID=F4L7G8_HALH1|nr:NAD(P)-dependent alcohol dehydrogenase [Haliscomenobacter hydrossis]AEE54148.1 NADPH:quinone reductase [Haliscomenobacter hydrossis DSM 1100]
MKAAVFTQYGAPEVLEVKELEKPMPKNNEILVRIKATAVNSGDWRMRKADPFAVRFIFGFTKPKINVLGSVFSGEIESVGEEVKQFKVGDLVFGHIDMSFGAYAEYKCLPENASIALKPANITHTEAAAIPFGGVTALHFMKKTAIKPEQKVLVVGASGAVGSAAVQLAKSFGAQVTGVCSTANIPLVKSIGADKVIDYTREDFTRNGETYDVIFDAVKAINVSRSLKSLNKNGTMILSAAGMPEMLQGLWISMTSSKKVMTGVIGHTAADIIFLKGLIEADKLKPVIDRTYSLAQIAEAHAYVEKGHKKGNVAIEV